MSAHAADPHGEGSTRDHLSAWWLLVGSVLVACVLARYVSDWVDKDGWGMIDLRVYRWGGDVARETDQLYDLQYDGFLPFTYTPFAAATFIPMALLTWSVAQAGMVLLNVTALLVTVGASVRSLGYELDKGGIGVVLAISAVGAMLEPVDETFHFGQVNLILMAIVVCDLLLPDTSRFKGIGVGVATGFKLTPAIFIPYLLLTKRLTAGVRAVVAAAATVAVGFVVLPSESTDFWFQHLFLDSTRVGGVAYVANQSVNGFVIRLTDAASGTTGLWLPLALAVAAVGFWTAVRVQRRGPELAGVLVCALTGLLISPVSWSHHWVWFVPALVLGFHLARKSGSWPAWIALGAGTLVVSQPLRLIWRVPSSGDREFSWTAAQMLQGNVYVVLGLVVLALAAWWTTRPPANEPGEAPRRDGDRPSAISDRSARR